MIHNFTCTRMYLLEWPEDGSGQPARRRYALDNESPGIKHSKFCYYEMQAATKMKAFAGDAKYRSRTGFTLKK
jgi:hypothetical protein